MQPSAYNQAISFAAEETNAVVGRSTVRTAALDAELAAIAASVNVIVGNISLLQRDDGQLRDLIVTPDSLSAETMLLIGSDWTPRGAWITAHAYVALDFVEHSNGSYLCLTAHTSGTFATDYAAGKWMIVGPSLSGLNAGNIAFTPNGTIAAATVQGAIAEAASEAAQKAANLSDLGNVGTALTNLGFSAYLQTLKAAASAAALRALLLIGTKSTVASSATPDIWTGTGSLIDYTGTVACLGFTAAPQAGERRTLLCAAAAPFTAGVNLLIDGVASGSQYIAQAGDKIDIIAATTTVFHACPRPIIALPTAYSVITGTRDASITTPWTVTGAGFKPRAVQGQLVLSGFSSVSYGFAAGPVMQGFSLDEYDAAGTWVVTGGLLQVITGAGDNNVYAVSSYDANGITLTASASGAPSGNFNYAFKFFR